MVIRQRREYPPPTLKWSSEIIRLRLTRNGLTLRIDDSKHCSMIRSVNATFLYLKSTQIHRSSTQEVPPTLKIDIMHEYVMTWCSIIENRVKVDCVPNRGKWEEGEEESQLNVCYEPQALPLRQLI